MNRVEDYWGSTPVTCNNSNNMDIQAIASCLWFVAEEEVLELLLWHQTPELQPVKISMIIWRVEMTFAYFTMEKWNPRLILTDHQMTDRVRVADDRRRQCCRWQIDTVLQTTVFHNLDGRDSVSVDNVVLMYVGFQMTCIQSPEFQCYPRSWCLPP